MTGSPRKRIAFTLLNMGGGGAERVALASMRDLIRRGHDVDVVLMSREGELLPLLPPEARIIDLKAARVRNTPLKLLRYFRAERPDAVHAMMWPMTIPTILAYRLAGLRGPLLVNDQIAYVEQIAQPGVMRAVALTTRLFYRSADHRVLCSKGAAEALSKLSGIPLDQFEVIYNPIEPPAQVAADPAIEQLWGGARKRIIAVGSLKQEKKHALLLDAFAALPDKSARLMILGEGALRGTLTEQAARLGISDRLVMPGFALDPWPYYASANLFVLSSDHEGFANV